MKKAVSLLSRVVSQVAGQAVSQATRPVVFAEPLESRQLFAAGLPDGTFNQNGISLVGFNNPSTSSPLFDEASAVVQQSDGKLVVVGTTQITSGTLAIALTRLNNDGTLDTTFSPGGTDGSGKTITQLAQGSIDDPEAMLLSNDEILVVGSLAPTGGGNDIVLMKYTASGSLDTTFGSNGVQVLSLANTETPTSIAPGPNNTLYVGGLQSVNGGGLSFMLTRLNLFDGTVDTSFGNGGFAPAPDVGGAGQIEGIAVQTDGSIVAAGTRTTSSGQADMTVTRYTSAGQVDTSFGTNGVYITDFAGQGLSDSALAMALQPDGKIVVVGQSGNALPQTGQSRFAMMRLNTNGTLDTSFATNGKYISTAARYETLDAVSILPDGRIIATGTSGDPAAPTANGNSFNADFAALRFTSTGALDPLFGTGGQRNVDLTAGYDDAKAELVDSSGRLVIVGVAGNTSTQGAGADFGVVRLTADTTALHAAVFNALPTVQGSNANFTITLDQPATAPVTINYVLSDGTAVAGVDYTNPGASSVTFAVGEMSKTVSVATLADAANTDGRVFNITISSADTNAAVVDTATASATIVGSSQPAPLPVISISNVTITEPASAQTEAVFTVTLDRASTSDVRMNFTTADGTAVAGQDYVATAGLLTIPAGQTSATIHVTILADTVTEPQESFVVNLTNADGAVFSNDNQGLAVINDTPPTLPLLSISGGTFAEPATGTNNAVFTISLSAASSTDVTVLFSTADGTANAGSDYTAVAGQLVTIPAGQTSATVTVPILADATDEGNETFTGTISSPTGALVSSATATATIVPPGAIPTLTVSNVTVAEALSTNSTATFTITLSAASSTDVTFNYTTADGTATAGSDYTATSGTITIPAGQTSATVAVTVLGDLTAESAEDFSLVLSNANGAQIAGNGAGTATITDAAFDTVTFSGKTKGTYTDATTGAAITYVIKGAGTGTVYFPKGTKTPDTLTLTGTNGASKVTVTAKGGQGFTTSNVRIDGDLGAFTGTKSFSVTGSFVDGGSLLAMAVRGVANAVVNLGNLGKFTTSGTVANSTFRVGSNIASFTAAALNNSSILTALPTTSTGLPTDASGLAGGSITKLVLKSFSNSRILSSSIAQITLGKVSANAGSTAAQGVVTDNLTKSASYTVVGAKATKLKAATTGVNSTSGDFVFRVV